MKIISHFPSHCIKVLLPCYCPLTSFAVILFDPLCPYRRSYPWKFWRFWLPNYTEKLGFLQQISDNCHKFQLKAAETIWSIIEFIGVCDWCLEGNQGIIEHPSTLDISGVDDSNLGSSGIWFCNFFIKLYVSSDSMR